MAFNLVRLVALASLAVIGASFGAQPANAVSLESHHFVRHDHAARHHGLVAKRQASTRPRRCRARTSTLADGSSSPASTSSTTSPATTRPASTSARPATTQAPPPAPTTSKAAAPATTSKAATNNNNNNNGGGGGSGKVGIAYAGNVNVPNFIQGSRQVKFIYNWSSWKPTWMDQIPWVEFVPMLWGDKQIDDFHKNVKGGFARFVLGMNEPNQEGQSNISPQRGVQLWREHIQPLKSQGYTLGSPAPTNAPSGKLWLQNFIGQCGGCNIDFIATHWYGTDAQQFIAHLQDYHDTFGRNIWVTEYACQDFSGRNQQCSGGQVSSFMSTTRNFMNGASWVQAYFYFGVLHDMNNVQYTNKLINGDSSPNTLGRTYIGY